VNNIFMPNKAEINPKIKEILLKKQAINKVSP
jgi:hypothetical protein